MLTDCWGEIQGKAPKLKCSHILNLILYKFNNLKIQCSFLLHDLIGLHVWVLLCLMHVAIETRWSYLGFSNNVYVHQMISIFLSNVY